MEAMWSLAHGALLVLAGLAGAVVEESSTGVTATLSFRGMGEGEYVLEDQEHLWGVCGVAAVDADGEGVDEVVVFQQDHSDYFLLVFGRGGPAFGERDGRRVQGE